MLKLVKNKDLYGITLFLLLLVLVGYQQLISPAVGVFLLVLLVEGFGFKSLRFRWNKITFLFVLLYLFYALGLLWSDHPEIGWKLLEYKMSFVIFPVFFLFVKETTNTWAVLEGLVWGAIVLTIRFFIQYYNGDPLVIEGYGFWQQIQPEHFTYQSIYLTLTSVLLIYGYAIKKISWPIYVIIPPVVVFSLLVLMMGSFAAILFLAFSVAFGIGFLIFRWLKWIGLTVFVILCPLLIYFVVLRLEVLKYDVEMSRAVYAEMKEGKAAFLEKNKLDPSGTKKRMILWMISAEIIAENPGGVGTGDIDFYLVEKCDKYGLVSLKESNLNPHNQFLQIGIDTGIAGMLLLLLLIAVLFYRAVKDRNILLLFVVLSLFFNALFESVLQRQSGIVFYTLLVCLLVVYRKQFKAPQPVALETT